jgi:hypothetical protein
MSAEGAGASAATGPDAAAELEAANAELEAVLERYRARCGALWRELCEGGPT